MTRLIPTLVFPWSFGKHSQGLLHHEGTACTLFVLSDCHAQTGCVDSVQKCDIIAAALLNAAYAVSLLTAIMMMI